ncbi:MAG: DUF2913 family protein [Aeromonas sp.]
MATPMPYHQALLAMARTSLAELARTGAQKASPRSRAQESHFLCTWLADGLKTKRFDRQVKEQLELWIQTARSQGAAADLTGLLERLIAQYDAALAAPTALGDKLDALCDELRAQNWHVIRDCALDGKARLPGDGNGSVVICANAQANALAGNELIAPLTLYMRGSEMTLALLAAKHGLLLSQGIKKGSLVKWHHAYRLYPDNAQPALALLAP